MHLERIWVNSNFILVILFWYNLKLLLKRTYQSAGAPGIPDLGAGTRTVFLSSVKQTHWSIRLCSRSTS